MPMGLMGPLGLWLSVFVVHCLAAPTDLVVEIGTLLDWRGSHSQWIEAAENLRMHALACHEVRHMFVCKIQDVPIATICLHTVTDPLCVMCNRMTTVFAFSSKRFPLSTTSSMTYGLQ